MKYFIPSKTFIAGEYSVLMGGSSLTVATEPSFEVTPVHEDNEFRFHPDSPAGKWWAQSKAPKTYVHFFDPYVQRNVKGGFGRSTAEYLAVRISDLLNNKVSVETLHREYLNIFQANVVKPSGVDLVTQYLGGYVVSNMKHNSFTPATWRFPYLDFALVSTGLKIPTHEHLKTLNLKSLEALPPLAEKVTQCFINETESEFLFSLGQWSEALLSHQLTHSSVVQFMDHIKKNIPEIKFIKPCGALGADVVMMFFDKTNKPLVLERARNLKLRIQATADNVTKGLQSELRNN